MGTGNWDQILDAAVGISYSANTMWKLWIQLFSLQRCVNSRADCVFKFCYGKFSRGSKTLNSILLKWTFCRILLVAEELGKYIYGFKYSYPIQIIFKHTWPNDDSLTGTATLDHSGPRSNGNEKVTLNSSKFQNWSFSTTYNLVLVGLSLVRKIIISIYKLYRQKQALPVKTSQSEARTESI